MRNARRLLHFCLWPLVCVGGCAGFWDEVSSRNFKFAHLYSSPDPLVVLQESDDGWQRSKALAGLQEPLAHGGTQKDQDFYVKILTESAKSDRDPLCRIAAVKTLGRFKDPRAAEALQRVTEQNLTFTGEMNNLLRQEALKSLAQTGSPLAVEQLVKVAKEPPIEGASQDRQEVLDRRLTAIRGLGKYDYPESKETLLYILQKERDAALRARAHESLVAITGKDYPPEAKAWAEYLHPGGRHEGDAVAKQPANNAVVDFLTWPVRQVRGY